MVHVLDASRAVGVVGRLASAELRGPFVDENLSDQEKLRETHRGPRTQKLRTLEEARRHRLQFDWDRYTPPQPSFTGIRVTHSVPLEEIVPYIDWTPFFHVWELRGIYPKIFEQPEVGAKARELFDDAEKLLDHIVRENLLVARSVVGFFPAASIGDDIEVYADESRTTVQATFYTLRQQIEKPDGEPNLALADFIAPRDTGRKDYLGIFAVTAGINIEPLVARFEKEHDDYNSIMAKALADRLAEALAELTHKRARDAWHYGCEEKLTFNDLIHEQYRGIRPAPGYPAQPDHTEKRTLFDLLKAEQNTGIRLTENFAMYPAASVCGLYFSHPEARYFAVGKIERDQVLDYQRRKGTEIATVERWLGPYLNYDPSR